MDLQADGGARSPEFYPLTGSRFRSCWQTHPPISGPIIAPGPEPFLETVAPLLLKRRPRVHHVKWGGGTGGARSGA